MAVSINEKFRRDNDDLKSRMLKEADERRQQLAKLEDEERERKNKMTEQKMKLRDIQEKDKLIKMAQKEKDTKAYKSADFAKTNLLSYIYEKKQNKAHEYRQKNEHLLNLI
mmetsp:Transcript_31651/g.48411  ORF Transcript_31651/g.48411 Transcript_31651/m.48411 type:complete len:111 (+) Transcript_31651:720-1052(+)